MRVTVGYQSFTQVVFDCEVPKAKELVRLAIDAARWHILKDKGQIINASPRNPALRFVLGFVNMGKYDNVEMSFYSISQGTATCVITFFLTPVALTASMDKDQVRTWVSEICSSIARVAATSNVGCKIDDLQTQRA